MTNKLPSIIRGRQLELPVSEEELLELVAKQIDGLPYITNSDGERRFIARHSRDVPLIQNIIVGGDYHYRDEAAGAQAALSDRSREQDRKDLHQRYALAREAREDRRQSTVQFGIFASIIVVILVIAFLGFGLAAIGMIHH